MKPRIPAVVAGGNLNGLGVVRSLARAAIPTFVMNTTRNCPAAWSRHANFVHTPSLSDTPFVSALQQLASTLKCRPVLFLTHDTSVATVSTHRSELAPYYHIEMPAPNVVHELSDKLAFDSLAARENFLVPRSRAIRHHTDLEHIAQLSPPLILKPADKSHALAGAVERTVRAETLEEARNIADSMLTHTPALIVQEWIEGPDSEIFFTLFCAKADGTPAALFSGRKLASNPPSVGSTAICIPETEIAELLEQETRTFLKRVPYRGLGSLEFKRDIRTGKLMIIEPTVGRTDWQEEVATLCGKNLPAIAYCLSLDCELPRPPPNTRPYQHAWRSDRSFCLPPDWPGVPRITDAHFRIADPLPGIYFYAYERGIRRISRRLKKLLFN